MCKKKLDFCMRFRLSKTYRFLFEQNMSTLFENIKQGLTRILKAFVYSYDGFKVLLNEPAFKQELCVFFVFTTLSFVFDVSSAERALMIFALFFILCAEAVNTAVEVCINRISTEIHPLSKKAKDIGSFVVLLSFVNAIVVWMVILL